MSELADLFEQISERLSEHDIGFALVGGLAVSARSEPRFTRDVDLAVVAADDREALGVISTMCPPLFVLQIVEHEALDRLAAVSSGPSRPRRNWRQLATPSA